MKKPKSKKSAAIIFKQSLIIFLITMKWLLLTGFLFAILAGGVVTGYVTALVKDDPVRSKEEIFAKIKENNPSGFVYFSDGTLVGQLRNDDVVDQRLIEITDVPKHVKDAFIAIEDNHFYDHNGVVLKSTLRAAKQKFLNEPNPTGGSTITQQVAKNVFLTSTREDSRKFKEILLALRMERFLSKDEIFAAYLNKVPFGKGSTGFFLYGIKAAAKGLFDIDDLNHLNIAQAAYLAGLPQLPSAYSAYANGGKFDEEGFDRAVTRQRLVLQRMLEEEFITQEEYNAALNFDIRGFMAKPEKKAYATYPFLMIETERRAAEILFLQQNPDVTPDQINQPEYAETLKEAREQVGRGGYKIYLTIDKTIYDAMQEIAKNPDNFKGSDDEKKGLQQIGSIMIENKTGAILGMIEGRDWYEEQLNHATQMERQPGSTMKPIAAFLPAIEMGKLQPATIIDDAPIWLPDWQKKWHFPANWNNNYEGLMTARWALLRSYNVPALKIFHEMVGIENAWAFVKKLGITTLTENDNHAQTGVIGGLEKGVSVEEMTNAYSAIGNKGRFNDAYMISKIEDAQGRTVYKHEIIPVPVFSEESAYLMTDMLHSVIAHPRGTAADIRYGHYTYKENPVFKYYDEIAVVGKTGSTQNDKDAWFMGYSPDVTVGVWTGYDQPERIVDNGTNRSKIVWTLIMNAAVELKPDLFQNKQFEHPANIIEMEVSDKSAKIPSELAYETGHVIKDKFNRRNIPTEEDKALEYMNVVTIDGMNYIPQSSTPLDMTQRKLLIHREKPLQLLLEELKTKLEEVPEQYRPTKTVNRREVPMTIEDFYTDDIGMDAPVKTDPRTEDGYSPAPPSNLKLSVNKEGKTILEFEASTSEDVVGYRIYQSVNGSYYQQMLGKVVYAGNKTEFEVPSDRSNIYGYYVVSVDVSGNATNSKKMVYTDGRTEEFIQLPIFEDSQGPDEIDPDEIDPNGEIKENDRADERPSPPSGVKIQPQETGSGVIISWNKNPANENIKRYEVWYSKTKDGSFFRIGETQGNSLEYVTTVGWYRVVAINNRDFFAQKTVEYKGKQDSLFDIFE
jgi:penicillin-binding protein